MRLKNLIVLALLGVVTSCNYLDVVPEKMGTIEYAFRDRRSALQYLATCYHYLPSLGDESNSVGRSCGTEVTTYYRNRENGVKITLEGNSINSPKLAYWTGDNGGVNLYKGLRCCNTFLENVDLIRKLITKQTELLKQGIAIAGGDYRYSVSYEFTGLNNVKPQMIEEATKNARAAAEKFAKDSDSSLGKIRNASQGQFSISDRDSNTPYIKNIRVVTTVNYYLKN